MQELKERLGKLGYKEVVEVDETSFLVGGNDVFVYGKKVEDGTELTPDLVTAINYDAMELNPFPAYAWITNGINNVYLNVEEMKNIAEIPVSVNVDKLNIKKREYTPIDIWSNKMYETLQKRFDDIHEQIYAMKDHVNNSNDVIDEICKFIYMEVFRLNHEDFILEQGNLAGRKFAEIFKYNYLHNSKDKKKVVEEIRTAFKEVKGHEDYVAENDIGEKIHIFTPDDHVKLQNPDVYESIMKALQDLGSISVQGVHKEHATLSDLSGDVLGRVFDVLLRRKYENKGGMGIYLTPRQVTEAAVEMVIHDLIEEGTSKIIGKDPKTGIPTFRVLDPCCGSAGFLIKALTEIKNFMLYELSGDKKTHAELFKDMVDHCFVGADNSPGMILKARINMALHGAIKAPIFQTLNSLNTPGLKPESFDAIITNPPFKKGGVSTSIKGGKELIEMYSQDIDEDGNNKNSSSGLSLGSKPNAKGKWSTVNSIDPAVLFIDRCLQLLKPGGLLMMVVPDGILSNSGDQYIREYIMGKKNTVTGEFEGGKAILKAVVSLPTETFKLSGAGAKTSLLYIQKKQHEGVKQGEVFMAVANEIGFEVKNNVEVFLGNDRNDLLRIVEAYKKGIN